MQQYENSTMRRRNPVKRNNMFFSESDFNYELMIGRDYVEQDMGQTVILYQVDLEKTKINSIYKEASKGDIVFKQPIEIPVVFEIEDAEIKTYSKNDNKGVHLDTGKLKFGVFEMTLKENDCDIKRGDYICVQVTPERLETFTVVDDGRVNYSNKLSFYGTIPYYRSIICSPVTEDSEITG